MRRVLLWVPSATLLVAVQVVAQAPARRASAGVTIITTGARLRAPVAFELGAKPIVDIGGVEEDPDLELRSRNGYLQAARFADGGFAVSDQVRVQYFDKAG